MSNLSKLRRPTLPLSLLLSLFLAACGTPAQDAPASDMAMPESAAEGDVASESMEGSEMEMADGSEMEMTGSSGMPEMVQVELSEYGVTSTHDSFQTGTAYRFVILNEGQMDHDLRLTPRGEAESMVTMQMGSEPHLHGNELIYIAEDEMFPGAVHTVDLTFFQPGEFEIACHVEGHFEAGMWLPIEVTGEVLATPTPIDPASIIYDPNQMPEAPCHVMGTTIMGKCTEEDIAAIKAQLLGTSAGEGHEHDDDAGHAEDGAMMGDDHDDAEHGADDHADEGGMSGDEHGGEGDASGEGGARESGQGSGDGG